MGIYAICLGFMRLKSDSFYKSPKYSFGVFYKYNLSLILLNTIQSILNDTHIKIASIIEKYD